MNTYTPPWSPSQLGHPGCEQRHCCNPQSWPVLEQELTTRRLHTPGVDTEKTHRVLTPKTREILHQQWEVCVARKISPSIWTMQTKHQDKNLQSKSMCSFLSAHRLQLCCCEMMPDPLNWNGKNSLTGSNYSARWTRALIYEDDDGASGAESKISHST